MTCTSPIRYRQVGIVRVTQGSVRETGERAGAGVVVISAAHFLIGVDGLAVAIALAAVQRDLGVAAIDGQWVLSAYGLAFGGTLLLSGRLGDLYGRRRVLVSGLGAFATGALAAALGYSPLQAGLALLPLDVIAFVVSLAGARAIARRTPRALLFPSFTLTAVAL